ncbi:hypothetical protein Ahy_A07g032726 [Arachis hypogaea]|uniref:Uncharacterized protein n=1 Tax=Arachis hypogaea TaxID=3818 RepID=A0A445C7L9_ARAHY|nr:hypothetical protein Ahy_A07g032726 [Arachis hypogaea]
MASEKSFLVLVHYRGLIKKKTHSDIKFTDKNPLSIFLKPTTNFAEFLNSIIQKLELQGMKRVEKLFYCIPISVLRDDMKYDSFVIGSDEDLEVLFHCCRQFSEIGTPELLEKLVDVVSSSGGSNRNTQTPATADCSSLRPVGASLSVPVIAPQEMVVASPSFAANLNRSGIREVGRRFHYSVGAPDGIDDALPNDHDADDVELDIIADDSGDDIAASNLDGAGRASSLRTQLYPRAFHLWTWIP